MMRIRMETDQVRMMASALRREADTMDGHMASIRASVEGANWQSQAREEYVSNLETLLRVNAQTTQAMRLMAQAAEKKAEQWEKLASKFNGPFEFIGDIWRNFLDHLNNTWQGIVDVIGRIQVPTFAIIAPAVIPNVAWQELIKKISAWTWPPSWWPPFNLGPANTPGNIDAGPSTPPVDTEPDYHILPVEPSRPVPRELVPVNGDGSTYTCATYAAARRPDLGTTQCGNERWADQAAANYICKYEDTAFQINDSNYDLTNTIAPGYALVWQPEHPYANDTYGHVAIVEEVYPDHLVFSEAVMINGVYQIRTKSITLDQLNNDLMWLIP